MLRLTRVSSRRQLMHRLRYLDKRESHYVHMYISVARDRGNLTGDTFCAQPSRVTGRINHPLYFPPDAPRKLKPLRVPGSGGVIHLENPSSSARQFPPYLLPVIFNIALLLPCTGASRYEISHVETNLSYISPPLSLSLSLSVVSLTRRNLHFFWHFSLTDRGGGVETVAFQRTEAPETSDRGHEHWTK